MFKNRDRGRDRQVLAGHLVASFTAGFGNTSLGLLLALGELAIRGFRREARIDFRNPIYRWFVVLLAAMVLSSAFSPRRGIAAGLSLGFALVVLGFVFGMQSVPADVVRRRLLPTLVVGSWLSFVYTVAAFSRFGQPQAQGLFTGSNALGTLIVLCTGVSLGVLSELRAPWRYLAIGAYLAMAAWALLVTYCRGAWLGFLAMLVVWGVVNRSTRKWVLLGVPLIMLAMITIHNPRGEIGELFSLKRGMDRIYIWLAALRIIRAYPLFGVGPGVYLYVSKRFALPGAPVAEAAFAHNLFLQVQAELGVLGSIAFVAILIQVLVAAWRLARQGDRVFAGVLAAILGVLVHQQVDIPIWGLEVGGAFWLVVGLTLAEYARRFARPGSVGTAGAGGVSHPS